MRTGAALFLTGLVLAMSATSASAAQLLGSFGGGQLSAPGGISTDPAGNVYVADAATGQIRKFTSSGALVPGLSGSQLAAPLAVAIHPTGSVYAADSGNDRIMAFNAAGAPLAGWPSAKGLAADVVTSSGLTLSATARADLPTVGAPGSAIDPRLLGVIQRLLRAHLVTVEPVKTGHAQYTAGGSISLHYLGRAFDVTAVDGSLVSPANLGARQMAEELSSFDAGMRPDEIGSPFAISGPGYFTDADHQDKVHIGFETAGNGRIRSAPAGVATDAAGNVYVADTFNDRVRKFSAAGTLLAVFGGFGSGPGRLNGPAGLAVDRAGAVYVADTGNNRIAKFTAVGAFVANWSGLAGPRAVATDPAGNVYVAGAGVVRRLSSGGASLGTLGTAGQIVQPRGVATDCRGNVYVTDAAHKRVLKFGEPGMPPTPCKPANKVTFGKLTRNRSTGTAKLTVVVPGPGKLVLSGSGLRKVTKTVKAEGRFTLRVATKGKTRRKLNRTGRATVRPRCASRRRAAIRRRARRRSSS